MREKRDFSLRRRTKPLSPEHLARILRKATMEKDADETYKRLTGEKIPDREDEK